MLQVEWTDFELNVSWSYIEINTTYISLDITPPQPNFFGLPNDFNIIF